MFEDSLGRGVPRREVGELLTIDVEARIGREEQDRRPLRMPARESISGKMKQESASVDGAEEDI